MDDKHTAHQVLLSSFQECFPIDGCILCDDDRQLEQLIRDGDLSGVRNLLDLVTEPQTITCIAKKFPDRDPVVCAIDCQQEKVALYLIEKCFPVNITYKAESAQCDQWCQQDHSDNALCPADYNALSLARQRHLSRVACLLQEVKDGVRRPGEGLAQLQGPPSSSSSASNKTPVEPDTKPAKILSGSSVGGECTGAAQARMRIQQAGSNYISKNGDTLIHEGVMLGPAHIHVAASQRLPINTQNFDGDTALHVAVKKGQHAAARALLSAGADLSIRNKLGQLPSEISSDQDMAAILAAYRPGLVKAVQSGDSAAIQRLIQLWCNPDSNIKNGKSALDLAKSRKDTDSGVNKCYSLLQQHSATLRLVQAVLAEDAEVVKEALKQGAPSLNVNTRYKGKRGASLLACAIEQASVDMVQLLLNTGRCQLSTRVPEHMDRPTGPSVPLYFKTLSPTCPLEVWKLVHRDMELTEDFEKDKDGNTPLLRAILNNKPVEFMQIFLKDLSFNRLLSRNKDGQTARDLAASLDRTDIVQLIDKMIVSGCGQGHMSCLPVSFYSEANVKHLKDQKGRSLLEVAIKSQQNEDIQALRHWASIEAAGCKLFKAAARGDVATVNKLNNADFTDQNGYTALTRALVYNQPEVMETLLVHRPELRLIADNSNRYPLHYAYALPEEQSVRMVNILLARAPEGMEHRLDMDGREPVEYRDLREDPDVLHMLHDARTLDAYRKRGAPLAQLPEGAMVPPDDRSSSHS